MRFEFLRQEKMATEEVYSFEPQIEHEMPFDRLSSTLSLTENLFRRRNVLQPFRTIANG